MQIDLKPGDEIIATSEIPSNTIEIVKLVVEAMFRIAFSVAIFLNF